MLLLLLYLTLDLFQLKDRSVATVKILGGAYGPLDEKITVVVEGPGLPDLRRQMEKTRSVVKLFNGAVDPFEDVEEKTMSQAHCRVTQHNLRLPVPSKCWFSVEGSKTIVEQVNSEKKEAVSVPGDYLGIQVNSLKTPNYKWAMLEPQELKGLILGVSEFICDDFEIRSKANGTKCRRYPRDAPVRVCWTPKSSKIEIVSDEEVISLQLDSNMLDDLRNLCDEIIRRIPNFVRLSSSQWPVLQTSPPGGILRTAMKIGAVSMVLVSLGLCIARSKTSGFWKNSIPVQSPISTEHDARPPKK